jgi:hypothetical protein
MTRYTVKKGPVLIRDQSRMTKIKKTDWRNDEKRHENVRWAIHTPEKSREEIMK